jgi:large subunit ribosomal protein L3
MATKFVLGKKIGMTTIYNDKGAQNVTLLECGSKVVDIKEVTKRGYSAVEMEIAKTKNKIYRKEFRLTADEAVPVKKGDLVDVSIFEVGEDVRISGTTKGKGFQGGVKRHGFKGGCASHGHKHDLRAPGSIGSGFPEHVVKGKRMAGRMGGERSTIKNLEVIFIDKENNLLGVKGPVPGIPGGIVEIRS